MPEASASHHKKPQPMGAHIGIIAACVVLAIVVIAHVVKVGHLKAELADTQEQLTTEKAQATQAQSDLDKAKSEAADLQTQLTAAKSKQADLQAQLDEAKEAANQQQTQVDKDKSQMADLQSQVDKSKIANADLQNQVNQSTAGSSQLLTQLDQAKIQSADLQGRLQKAESDLSQLQPLLLKARHLPVTTAVEKKSSGRRGFALHIRNLYTQPLTVNLTITGADGTRTQSNVIGASATLDVDRLAAGEKIAIASDGYDPMNVTVP